MNKPNIHNNIIGDILSFQNALKDIFSSTGFCFKCNVIEGSHERKKALFFNFWAHLYEMYIFEVVTFFSCLVVIQSAQFFSGSKYL